jgi:hypothetical protein
MTSLCSCGPGLSFLRFGLVFFAMLYYYLSDSLLWVKWCPSRGSDPDAANGHAIANRACLPVPALGQKKES